MNQQQRSQIYDQIFPKIKEAAKAATNVVLKRDTAYSPSTQFKLEKALIGTRKIMGVSRSDFYKIVAEKLKPKVKPYHRPSYVAKILLH